MLAVQDDWIQYEAVPVRRTAVRGGAVCAQRVPVVSGPPAVREVTVRRDPAPAVAGRRRLRLTRRGRFVLVVLPGLLAVSGALVALSGTPVAEAAPQPVAARTVVVAPGDSLWSIAERTAPERDPREVVAALQRVNGLTDATVAAGAVLRLPADR